VGRKEEEKKERKDIVLCREKEKKEKRVDRGVWAGSQKRKRRKSSNRREKRRGGGGMEFLLSFLPLHVQPPPRGVGRKEGEKEVELEGQVRTF